MNKELMQNLLKSKTNLLLLAAGIILIGIVIVIAVLNIFQSNPSTQSHLTPTPVVSQAARATPPVLRSTIAQTKQGVFTVAFPKAPNPQVITITLASSTLSPTSPTVSVPFTSQFQDEGKLLVITTTQPLSESTIYTLYVRLKSNNHIVVKHRYESKNGTLTIIDKN